MTVDSLQKLEQHIGHTFVNRNILQRALCHSSHAGSKTSYERLEFLGDRVLGLLLADYFYAAFPDDDEGELSIRLHDQARMSTLASVARNLELADYIQSQTGFDIASNDSVMADVVESIMAAIYLDAGLNAAKTFLNLHWPLNNHPASCHAKDPKSSLQEWSLKRGLGLPEYRLVAKDGPDHVPQMTYEVKIKGYNATRATAGSRKIAEQKAAASFLEKLKNRVNG